MSSRYLWKPRLETVSCTNTDLESASYGQDIFGVGVKITKSKGYSRPSLSESPLTRFSFRYQEIEDNPDPFFYKIGLTKSPESRRIIDYTLTDKQAVSLSYENAMTKVFIEGHTVINMPDNKLSIPDVVKSFNEWSLVYP